MLTLVIPTRNRSSFLKRVLQYYAELSCPYPIIIGDSSAGESLAETQGFLKKFSSQLNLQHIIAPQSLKGPSKGWQGDPFLRDLIHAVQTPYVAFYADDDFAVVSNLKCAVDFLESNKDYSFVCGEGFLFSLKSEAVHGEIAATSGYEQRGVTDGTAAGRLATLLSHYVVLEYGVSRTGQMKARWKKVFDSGLDNLGGELLNCCLVVLQGKAEKMDRLFLARQGHAGQSSRVEKIDFDQFAARFFSRNYSKVKEILTEDLTQTDQALNREEAAHIIQEALQNYVRKNAAPDVQSIRFKIRAKKSLKMAVKHAPGLLNLLRGASSFLPGGKMTLRNLLKPSSPYHADFMPIYRAVKC